MQVRPGKGNPAGKWQRTAMDVMRSMGLDKIRETARAADASHGGYVLVPNLSLLDQLEIESQDGKIAATGAPGRVIGRNFLFRECFAFGLWQRDGNNIAVAHGAFRRQGHWRTHKYNNYI